MALEILRWKKRGYFKNKIMLWGQGCFPCQTAPLMHLSMAIEVFVYFATQKKHKLMGGNHGVHEDSWRSLPVYMKCLINKMKTCVFLPQRTSCCLFKCDDLNDIRLSSAGIYIRKVWDQIFFAKARFEQRTVTLLICCKQPGLELLDSVE